MSENSPPAYTVQNEQSSSELLLVCDHASRYIPPQYDNLGVADASLLHRHIAWDIGIKDVTARLADRLNITAVFAEFSRLLVDANRYPEDRNSMPENSDGIEVPANSNISDADRQCRLDSYFKPYHDKVTELVATRVAAGKTPIILSMHSFTPIMHGFDRPWHIGILWDQDNRLSDPMLSYLRKNPSLVVGDNEPYSARSPMGYSMNEYGTKRNFPHAAIEIRQDLIDTHHGAESWANIMADAIIHVRKDVIDNIAR